MIGFKIGKYISAVSHGRPANKKTESWSVCADEGDEIGVVQWYGPWRQYCFMPGGTTVFHNGCLRDVAAFLDRVNADHKSKQEVGK